MAAETSTPGSIKGSQIEEPPTERRAGSGHAGLALLAAAIATMLVADWPASAADLSWSTTPSNGNYNNGSNWVGATIPARRRTG